MEQTIKQFDENYAQLKRAIDRALSAKDMNVLNDADNEIGRAFHTLHYGIGAVAIEVKKAVDGRRRLIRTGSLGEDLSGVKEEKKQPVKKQPAKKKKK